MALRGKKPEERIPRLKALLSGEAGVGKTTAAIQMPRPYIIDAEGGTGHYRDIIEKKGGVVFATDSLEDAVNEVRALATEKHDFLTLVVDPFTTLYDNECERAAKILGKDGKDGTEFGRHKALADRTAKRFYNLVAALDMNVIITTHAKTVFGKADTISNGTFDGWKKLDYLMDLWFHLDRDSKLRRMALIKKTRLAEFPDQEQFEWSYDALVQRYGREKLERVASVAESATDEQRLMFEALYAKLTEQEIKRLKIDKVISSLDDLQDLPAARVAAGITLMQTHLKG